MKKFIPVPLLLIIVILFSHFNVCYASVFLYEIRIPFLEGEKIVALLPKGDTVSLGRVLKLPEKSRWPSYSASAWGEPGTVTATAVNALHLLIDIEKGSGRTISIVPRETIAPAAGSGASIIVDTKAGTGLFGAWAPPAGTKISVIGINGIQRALSAGQLPQQGETLSIKVLEHQMPYYVEFENRPGGRVISWSKKGMDVLARVLKPVGGVGRFEGTLFQESGRIRANHAGVIDVSTSPYGKIGGFQIIPWDHAIKSKEMQGAWNMPQWMILAPEDGKSMMGGKAPLFGGNLIPGTAGREELWDIWSTYGRRPLVLCRINGCAWGKLPIISGKVDDGLDGITHLRIYFPIAEEPLP